MKERIMNKDFKEEEIKNDDLKEVFGSGMKRNSGTRICQGESECRSKKCLNPGGPIIGQRCNNGNEKE